MAQPVRVGMVVEQCWQTVPGGSATYIVQLTAGLRRLTDVRVRGIAAAHTKAAEAFPLSIPVAHSRIPRLPLYESWRRTGRPFAEQTLPGLDVCHAPTWAIPGTRKPLAVTVHDLAFLRNPDHFTRRGVRYFQDALRRCIDEADAIIVPSAATADDCYSAGIEPGRVHVIPHGVEAHTVTDSDIAAWRKLHGIYRPYVVWVGTLEPRKNLSRLMQAFAHIPDVDLVLIGPRGWGADSAVTNVDPSRVHLTGFLDAAQVSVALSGAELLCFPSIWEGFGFPVLEAMAQGTPVVTSANTSMAEIVGEDGVLVDAMDPDSIATGITQSLLGDRATQSMIARNRAAQFTWNASAQAHADVYRSLITIR